MIGGEVVAVGQYTVTYASLSLGLMKGEAGVPTLIPKVYFQNLNSTDKYARTKVTKFLQGADWQAQFTCLEYKASVTAALWPFGSLGVMPLIGRDAFDLSAALILTAVTGTPAATAGPASITASKAFLADDYNPALLFGPWLREVPIKLDLFPYLVSTVPLHFVIA